MKTRALKIIVAGCFLALTVTFAVNCGKRAENAEAPVDSAAAPTEFPDGEAPEDPGPVEDYAPVDTLSVEEPAGEFPEEPGPAEPPPGDKPNPDN